METIKIAGFELDVEVEYKITPGSAQTYPVTEPEAQILSVKVFDHEIIKDLSDEQIEIIDNIIWEDKWKEGRLKCNI